MTKITDGKHVGAHQGAHFFTKGQRKGLGVGGTPEPLFIIDTDVEENIVYNGQGKQHPGLLRRGLLIAQDEVHWVRDDLKIALGETLAVQARIRYRQTLKKATLYSENKACLCCLTAHKLQLVKDNLLHGMQVKSFLVLALFRKP